MSNELATQKTEMAKVDQTEAPNIIAMAIQSGMDAESLKVLYELQKEERSSIAKAAYDKAMSKFNANPPTIVKDKRVSFSQTNYKHATLANVVSKIKSSLASHGLSMSWRTDHRENGEICVTAIISHELGHSEKTTMCGRPDDSGKKNSIQQIGSTVTYLERYTALAITGLAAFDDDDGISSEAIDEEKIAIMQERIKMYVIKPEDFLKWVGVVSVEQMTPVQYKTAMAAIEDIRKGA